MRRRLLAAALLALLNLPLAAVEPPARVKGEVEYLIGYVASAGCAFYRNGFWYDAAMAQGHLRDKYDYLVAHDLVNSTEDFIDRAATSSSFSGLAYEVRCRGGAAMPSQRWLRAELARYRAL